MSDDKRAIEEKSKLDLVKEILPQLQDPIHQRILKAYSEANPVGSMEGELKTILLEILNDHETQKA
jgi:hypothetical protein